MTGSGKTSARWAALAVALLGACGGLETPDFVVGDLAGRIVGAAPGAYVYPLGRAELKTRLAPDGSWTLHAVPVEVDALVLWDGRDRAERVPVTVAPGARVEVADRFGADSGVEAALQMPLAGTLLVGVDPEGGAIGWLPSFSVRGTEHARVRPASGGVETIYPLPPGIFVVDAAQPGFLGGSASFVVAPGATSASQVRLTIDAGAQAPGCGSAPGCQNGLVCDPDDGRCYVCTATDASACRADEVCDVAAGMCAPSVAGAGDLCASCRADAECASGACAISPGDTTGFCSRACTGAADCPAGFACGDPEGYCAPPEGCVEWIRTMGAPCVNGSACEDGLKDGRCVTTTPEAVGYCSATCLVDADCRIGSGSASTMTCTAGLCALP
jgi:hypothetical protein